MTSETGCGCYGACAPALTLDPHKRVHYAQGQVLGVDEFVQEEYYFLEGARRHHRTLHGYGTVCGLAVSANDLDGGIEIRVEPGHAIDTHGRELRVDTAQCARLDTWLDRQDEASPPLALPSPPELFVWVVLCYRECLTDLEPIPGGPCRTPDEAMTATRVTETFSLRFDVERPDMSLLDAIRDFARLIGRLVPVPGGAPGITLDDLRALVAEIGGAASPPVSPPDGPIDIPQDVLEDYLDAAFNTWVTEVRPALAPEGTGCADAPGGDGCIALARLRVPVADADGTLIVDGDATAVAVEDDNRPLLLSTQLIQELLINGGATGAGGGATEHDQLIGLEDDDHRQYLRIEPRTGAPGPDRMVNDIAGGTFTLRDLPNASGPRDAMPWGQPAAGDLSQSYPDPRVSGLQGLSVPQPSNADVGRNLSVGRVGSQLRWELTDAPAGGGGEAGEENLVRLRALSWFHNAPSNLRFTLIRLSGATEELPGIAIAFGIREVGDARVLLGVDPNIRRFDLGSLDVHSFRIYAELDVVDDRLPSSFPAGRPRVRHRLIPTRMIPINPRVDGEEMFFRSGEEIAETAAPGAFLQLDEETHNAIVNQQLLVWIEIDGDHVLGRSEDEGEPLRAVDTEFLRSRLPSGDRAERAERGTQGGLFSSWINRANEQGLSGPGFFDANRADEGALREFGLTAAAARNFVRAREEAGGFRSVADIPSGAISRTALTRLSNRERVFFGAR